MKYAVIFEYRQESVCVIVDAPSELDALSSATEWFKSQVRSQVTIVKIYPVTKEWTTYEEHRASNSKLKDKDNG